MNPTLVYKCSNCDEVHNTETEAQECCSPIWAYRCENCKEVHEDEDAAAECCAVVDDFYNEGSDA